MTNDGLNTMVGACPERSRRDAENHVVSVSNSSGAGTYTYDAPSASRMGFRDGNGQRIKKIGGGNTIITLFSGSQVLDEYYNGGLPSSPGNEYVYAGNLRVAIIQNGTSTYYWHNDHLSPRVRTDSSGNIADQRATFPFGETWYTPNSSAPWVFTTYYRDVEAEGNDYARARTYVGGLGRFSSPDPVAGSTSDPQSLNRYSYVRNMPVSLTDPFGLIPGGSIPVAKHANPDSDQNSDANADSKGHGPADSDADVPFWEPEPQASCANEVNLVGGGGVSIDGGESFDPGSAWGITGFGTDGAPVSGGTVGIWTPGDTVISDAGTTGDDGYWTFIPVPGEDGPDNSSSGGFSGWFSKIKNAICDKLPSGRSTSVSAAAGGVGSVGGSLDMVVNYNSGQTSLFATGGGGLGWNGGGSLTATTGLVFGMNGTNDGFSGPFKGANFYAPTPVPAVGAGISVTHGGGVTVVSLGVSGALAGRYGGGGSATNTTRPLNIGKFTGFTPLDYVGYLLRLPCR